MLSNKVALSAMSPENTSLFISFKLPKSPVGNTRTITSNNGDTGITKLMEYILCQQKPFSNF